MPRKKKKRPGNSPAPDHAAWLPSPNTTMFVTCSKCAFQIETLRAVETGWSISEHVALRYHFCPVCGRPMKLYQDLETACTAATDAAPVHEIEIAEP